MSKINFFRTTLFINFFFLLSAHGSAQKTFKTVPENLHGFWQFHVDKKGDWNGLHIGKNFIESFYDLAKADSVTQAGNRYTVFLTFPNRRSGSVVIDLLADNKAEVRFSHNNNVLHCARFDNDPDIDVFPILKYNKIIDGVWISGNDVRKPLSVAKNKLSWNGETWNIHWMGEYLKKEFRALVEKNNEYRLIYISREEDNLLKLVFNQSPEFFRPMPVSAEQNLLYGTWCDPKSNEWIIGFFDKIAVYQNRAWQYEVTHRKKQNYTVELRRDTEKQQIQINIKGKDLSQCELKDGKNTQTLVYFTKPQSYAFPDVKPFADNGYRTDTVTISGYVQNNPNKQIPFEVIVPNFLTDKQDEYFADIDENGLFTVKFPVLNTTQIYLDWERSYLTDVVEPGETYFLCINYSGARNLWGHSNAVVWQMGKNARIHREITAHQFATKIENYPYFSNFEGTPDEYLATCNAIYQQKLENLNQYIARNPIQSERFKYFKTKDELLELGFYLMQNRFNLNRAKNERFSSNYLYKADSIFKNLPMPHTSNRNVSSFLRDYTGYYKDVFNNRRVVSNNQIDAMKYFDKQGVYSLTNTQLEAIEKAWDALSLGIVLHTEGKDSAFVAKEMEPFEKHIKIFNEIADDSVFNQLYETEWKKVSKKILFNKEFAPIDSLEMSDVTRDLVLLQYAFSLYNRQRKPLDSVELNLLNKRIKNSNFISLLQREQDKYVELQGQSIRYIESLKRTDHLAEAKDADELLKKLTEPYLGKTIYIDFWGVWCGPCKEQMQYVGKVKEALKDKDVVFMYFANRSPEDSWKNVIKEYDLTGENVVHYNLPENQQAMLERRLGINSFPTYMIMDKTGKIVDMNPPMPIQARQLIDELSKWIEK